MTVIYPKRLNKMNIRTVLLCIALGLTGCNSNPVINDAASSTGSTTKSTITSSVPSLHNNTGETPSNSVHKQYRCADLNASQAQALLVAGHSYLDLDGDGYACEPDVRRDYSQRPTQSSSSNCHWVEGYTRKNGTKVRGHNRCR
jgi:hypothetical protein